MLLNPFYEINADVDIPHRYWRVRGPMNQIAGGGTSRAISCAILEFRSTPGGANIATGGTPLASAILSGTYPASNAFNGDGATFWISSNAIGDYGTQWIGYDFGSPVIVKEISWAKRPDSFGQSEALLLGAVQYSDDGSTWFTSWAFTTPATWPTGAETRVFTKTPLIKRFWQVRPTALQGGSSTVPSFAEVEMRETPGGSDMTSGGQAIATRAGSLAIVNNAFDNNNSTFWAADSAVSNLPWIGYAFANSIDIREITLRNRNDTFGAAQGITAGDVRWSLDGVNWTTEWSFTSPATWVNSAAETRVFTKP
jgi:hypothetical protein